MPVESELVLVSVGSQLAATYEADPARWPELTWYDRTTGQPIHTTTLTPHDPNSSRHLADGRVRIRTLGDVLAEFRR